jgi:hypothetical protein
MAHIPHFLQFCITDWPRCSFNVNTNLIGGRSSVDG